MNVSLFFSILLVIIYLGKQIEVKKMNPLFPLLFQYNRQLTAMLNEVLRPYGLFSAQWSIVYYLHKNGPRSLTQIWQTLAVEAPTVTRTVTRLEKLGWVMRVEGEDRREKIITLTPVALSKLPDIKKAVSKFEQQAVNALSEDEQQQLQQLIEKMKG